MPTDRPTQFKMTLTKHICERRLMKNFNKVSNLVKLFLNDIKDFG